MPSTSILSVATSALAPSSVTGEPFTKTRPSVISSSAFRRDAIPALAIIFWRRSPATFEAAGLPVRVVFFLTGLAAAGLRPEPLRPPGLALPELGLSGPELVTEPLDALVEGFADTLPAPLPDGLPEGPAALVRTAFEEALLEGPPPVPAEGPEAGLLDRLRLS